MILNENRFTAQIVDILTGEQAPLDDAKEVRFASGIHYIVVRIDNGGQRLIVHAGGGGEPKAFILRPQSSNTFLIGLERL